MKSLQLDFHSIKHKLQALMLALFPKGQKKPTQKYFM